MSTEALSGIVRSYNYCLFYLSFKCLWLVRTYLIPSRCLGHVINLGNIDVMGHITKIAAVENATAIWEYDPTREDSRVLGGSLDVIAAIRTLAIKVIVNPSPCGALIQYLHLDSSIRPAHRILPQIHCGLPEALKIPLHSNI